MEEILVCRICLITDVKLKNIQQYGLSEHFETITGINLISSTSLPQCICSICSSYLKKCIAFRELCGRSQETLATMLEHGLIKTSYFKKLDRKSKKLNYNLCKQVQHDVIELMYVEKVEDKVKIEVDIANESVQVDKVKDETYEENIYNDNDYPPCDSPGFSKEDDEPIISFKEEKPKLIKKKKVMDVKNIQRKYEDLNIEMIILSKKEQLEEIEARKNSTNYISALYKCDQCYKGFLQMSTYNNHMAMHESTIGPFKCDVCGVYCADEKRLKAHKKVSHERRFICRICKNVATTSHYAREHQKWHKGVTYDCKKCNRSFSKTTSYLTHLRLHHPSEHTCDICGESFLGKGGLNTHKLKTHKNDSKSNKSPTFCIDCDVYFKNMDAFNIHISSSSRHTKTGCLFKPCLACGECFETDDTLFEHKKKHKSQMEKVKCKECGRMCVFTNYSAHYRKCHVDSSLDDPKKRVIIKNYVCEVCGKKCSSKSTLSYHQRTHTGECPFECPVCHKKFKVHQLMKIHYRVHTGETPYTCTVCPKAFKHKAALNRHIRVHTGDKPYTCPYCGKSFSQSNSLKLHVNTVHLKLPAPYKKRNKITE